MTALRDKDAIFCFATRGFNFFTRKTNLDTPEYSGKTVWTQIRTDKTSVLIWTQTV